ncbi:MAG TPA: porin, partial [Burkholderiales bacterium]|nr:porin [Burkholderiales bacterium]
MTAITYAKHRKRALLLASLLVGTNGYARADDASALKEQVDVLQRKVDALANNSLPAGATKGSFKIPGSDTSVTLGGYVKFDAIMSDKSAGVDSVGDQQLNINLVPVGPTAGQHKKDQVTLHARQTRLSLGTSTPTSYGGLTTYIEGDFF